MSIISDTIGGISSIFKSFVDLLSLSNTKPKNYDEACSIARKNAKLDTVKLRKQFYKEQMSMYRSEAYGKDMREKEKEIDIIEEEKYQQHLNNILKLYKIDDKKD